jgi:hypothetical protein
MTLADDEMGETRRGRPPEIKTAVPSQYGRRVPGRRFIRERLSAWMLDDGARRRAIIAWCQS